MRTDQRTPHHTSYAHSLPSKQQTNSQLTKMTGMKMPLEIYPLVGMMGVALGLGGYTSYKHLSTNPDMRLTPAQGSSDVENWQSRIEKVSEKKRFTNFFYNFDKI